jgi:hypothetical protein
MRAAIEAAPYKHPKLSVSAVAKMDGKSFAEQLERAIERSKQPVLLNGPSPTIDAAEMKKPFATYRRF